MGAVDVNKDLMHILLCMHLVSVKVIIKYLLASKIEELHLKEK